MKAQKSCVGIYLPYTDHLWSQIFFWWLRRLIQVSTLSLKWSPTNFLPWPVLVEVHPPQCGVYTLWRAASALGNFPSLCIWKDFPYHTAWGSLASNFPLGEVEHWGHDAIFHSFQSWIQFHPVKYNNKYKKGKFKIFKFCWEDIAFFLLLCIYNVLKLTKKSVLVPAEVGWVT